MRAWMLLVLVAAALVAPAPALAQDRVPTPTATATPTATPTPPVPVVPPANDAFAAPVMLSAEQPTAVGSTSLATVEPGEPAHAGQRARSVWFDYTPDRDGTVGIDTCGSSFDTVLAVYTGTQVGGLTGVAADDDAGCGAASHVSFAAQAGVRYRIALDGFEGASGLYEITLDESNRPANDEEENATFLSDSEVGSNVGATSDPGEPVHADVGGGHSVWYALDIGPTGAARVTVNTCDATFDTVLAVYTTATAARRRSRPTTTRPPSVAPARPAARSRSPRTRTRATSSRSTARAAPPARSRSRR
jgi:hypothetical protein